MTSHRLLLVLALFLLGTPFLAADSVPMTGRAQADADRLLAAASAAEDGFRPLAESDLLRAQSDLSAAVERLEKRLALDNANGEAWSRYLKLDELRAEADREATDLNALEAAFRRFNAGYYGLNRIWFAEVRVALMRCIQVVRALETPGLENAYRQYIGNLASHLSSYAEAPNAERAVQIGEAIGWLESIGQAPALIAAVREELARPNLFVTASQRLVTTGIDEPVDETEPVRDQILGTDLYGVGHTLGHISLALVPSDSHAVFDITYLGVTRTRNTGYNGPVVIFSNGTTGIGARKRVWVNASGVHSHRARANAATRSEILDIQPQRGGRMVERIAWRKAMQQKHLAEAVASRRAEARASQRMDARASKLLDEANDGFHRQFRQPLVERNLFPRQLQFGSVADALRIAWLQAGAAQLAAPAEPPEAVAGADLTLRIHESMVNNAIQSVLTGLTISDDEFRSAVAEVLGRVPDQLKPIPGEEPWGITFDRAQPIEVRFREGGFDITLFGRRYTKGDQPHPGMNVSARYEIVHDADGFRAVRQGEVDAVPPGWKENQQLGTRHQIIRTMLIRRFETIFEKEIRLAPMDLPERYEELGPMPVVQFEANDGWLTVAWKAPE